MPQRWWLQANCKNLCTNEFFPTAKEINKIKAAKAICRACSVRKECLQEAIENNLDGIYGGTTLPERILMSALMPGLRKPLQEYDPWNTQLLQQEQTIPEATDTSDTSTLQQHSETSNPPDEPYLLVLLEYDIVFDVEVEDQQVDRRDAS